MTKLIYVDGVHFNPDNVTWMKLLDPGRVRLHFIGGNFVDVDKDWDAFRKRLRNAGVRICGDTIEDWAWECDAPQEENKEGKETFPPAPPIEKSPDTKEEASHTLPRACARTRAGKSRGRKKVAFPPSIEEVYAHADERGIPRMFADYWYDKEEKTLLWRDKHTHRTIKHTWRDVFESYWCYAGSDELWAQWQKDHAPETPPKEEKHYNLLGEVR